MYERVANPFKCLPRNLLRQCQRAPLVVVLIWLVAVASALPAAPGDVVINEIAWMGTAASANDEWIELYNTTNSAISLTGWTLAATDGTPSITLSGTIPANGFFLLERTDDTTVNGITADQIYVGVLGNTGEDLELKDTSSILIDSANGDGGSWPAGDNSSATNRATMERINPFAADTDVNWATNDGVTVNGLDANSNPLKGTPKAHNSVVTRITLTITGSGSGTGTVTNSGISCTSTAGVESGDCAETFVIGASVTITANAASGSAFVKFTDGGCSTSPSCTLTMSSDITVDTEFDLAPPSVTTTKTDALLIDNDNDGQADPGDRVQYTVVITNSGTTSASGVTFTDTPDANTSLVVGSVTTTPGTVTTGNTAGDTDVAVSVGSISGSGSATITFDVDINSPLLSGVDEICNQGEVSGDNFTTVLTDDPDDPTGAADETCTPIDKDPSLVVTKTDALTTDNNTNSMVDVGDILTYTVVITNNGNGIAQGVVLSDLAGNHPSATLVDGSVTTTQGSVTNGNGGGPDTDVSVAAGNIAADGGSVTITFQVTVGNPSPASEVCNQGTVSGSNFTNVLTNDPDDPTGNADPTCTQVVTAPALPHDFLFLAEEFVESKKHKLLQGDVHSNNDIILKKGKKSKVVGNLFAVDDIDIGKKNDIDGNVTAGHKVDNDGDVSGAITEDAGVADVPLPLIAPFAVGTTNIEVAKKATLPLAPGSYGNVEVEKQGTLELTSGTYFMKSLELNKKTKLCIDVSSGLPVIINISDDLVFGKQSEVIIKPNGEEDSELVTFNFADDDDNNGDDDFVEIGKKAKVLGTIVAPDAWVVLQSKSRFKGAICAENIVVKSKVVALHHSVTASLPKAAPDDEDEEGELNLTSIPSEFELGQNYPNPFNPSTTISFALPKAGEISLRIYNLRGQLVATLHSGALAAGRHKMAWEGKDALGANVASGIYVYRLEADGFIATKKLTLMK